MSREIGRNNNKTQGGIRIGSDGMPVIPEGVTVFFLSEVIRKPVLLKSGLSIGKLKDIAVKLNGGPYPEASHVVVWRPRGYPDLWLPWNLVDSVTEERTVVEVSEKLEHFEAPHRDLVLLDENIMDKKIIDMEDREVEVVYDVQLVFIEGKLYVTHVDASQSGLLRRMRLGFLNKLLYGKRESPDLVPWHYVHVPSDMGPLRGNVRLNVQREKLKDIHPVDLADILEELGHEERMQIFDSFDTEKAADILEEIEPRVQREVIKSVRQERMKGIFQSMTSAQLADLLCILPTEEANKFIDMLDPSKAAKVRAILSQHEETVSSLVSQTFLAFPGDMTVKEAFKRFRREAHDRDVIMYIYIVTDDNVLKGVIDIRELLQAEPDQLLSDIMVKNVITVEHDDAKDDVIELFKRYYFRAMPVVDEQDRLIGVLRFKDLFIGQKGPVSAP